MANDALQIAAAGMQVQRERMRVIAENIANADSTATTPGADPYRRKTVTFQNVLDRETGVDTVKVGKRGYDMTSFIKKYDPSHPAADAQGYVMYPNVNPIIEMTDMRDARFAYEANINVVEISKSIMNQTLALLNK